MTSRSWKKNKINPIEAFLYGLAVFCMILILMLIAMHSSRHEHDTVIALTEYSEQRYNSGR